jgi:hypothetical protein
MTKQDGTIEIQPRPWTPAMSVMQWILKIHPMFLTCPMSLMSLMSYIVMDVTDFTHVLDVTDVPDVQHQL